MYIFKLKEEENSLNFYSYIEKVNSFINLIYVVS